MIIKSQKYVRITVYHNGHMGTNKVLTGRSIALKIPDYLALEEEQDNLLEKCHFYLKNIIFWNDIIEWEHAVIEEKELDDSSFDAELVDSDHFYKCE